MTNIRLAVCDDDVSRCAETCRLLEEENAAGLRISTVPIRMQRNWLHGCIPQLPINADALLCRPFADQSVLGIAHLWFRAGRNFFFPEWFWIMDGIPIKWLPSREDVQAAQPTPVMEWELAVGLTGRHFSLERENALCIIALLRVLYVRSFRPHSDSHPGKEAILPLVVPLYGVDWIEWLRSFAQSRAGWPKDDPCIETLNLFDRSLLCGTLALLGL